MGFLYEEICEFVYHCTIGVVLLRGMCGILQAIKSFNSIQTTRSRVDGRKTPDVPFPELGLNSAKFHLNSHVLAGDRR